jgi:aconitate hydratase
VNLEHLAGVVETRTRDGLALAFPDSVIGTDSHTTMINGLGVIGWGVGGIEAEAAMLGQPVTMTVPPVVGVRLRGRIPAGATITDTVLTITQILRKKGVVGKFVEFFGEGAEALGIPDRATIANMAPEYGATMGFFPPDQATIEYLTLTGRSPERVALTRDYLSAQGLLKKPGDPDPQYDDIVEIDLAGITPCVAGPRRPQDRVPLGDMKKVFHSALTLGRKEGGFGVAPEDAGKSVPITAGGADGVLRHGSVVIASITSCTSTSNPAAMIAAGLLARNAVARGLAVPATVKCTLSPGSRVVADYLGGAGLLAPLEKLGFAVAGYGCMTCIGNSGPLDGPVAKAVKEGGIIASAVLSGNRNFEGRIHPLARASYLASPPLVVAFALAGTADIDLNHEPLGTDSQGRPVFLRDIWPSSAEVAEAEARNVRPEMFRDRYAAAFRGDSHWQGLPVPEGAQFAWEPTSTYIRRPPFLENIPSSPVPAGDIKNARALAVLGDSVTTDHISPAGSIPLEGPAGQHLARHGFAPADFNSFGSRRGNHKMMMRGTFANIRLTNLLAPGTEGGVTLHLPDGAKMSIFEASEAYKKEGVPLVVIAGREYGTGSSRDWAAKGPALLGVRAVIAVSFERIHRSNLIQMGVLPLEFLPGQDRESLGLTGHEVIEISGISGGVVPRAKLKVTAAKDGATKSFEVMARIDTAVESEYFRHGGILPFVLRSLCGKA